LAWVIKFVSKIIPDKIDYRHSPLGTRVHKVINNLTCFKGEQVTLTVVQTNIICVLKRDV